MGTFVPTIPQMPAHTHRISSMKHARTPEQARAEFERRGVSIAAWARDHGVSRSLVYEILAGRKKCHRGDSHRIAVLLGLKDGTLPSRRASAAEAMGTRHVERAS